MGRHRLISSVSLQGSDMQVARDAGADIVGDEDIVPLVLSREVKAFVTFCGWSEICHYK